MAVGIGVSDVAMDPRVVSVAVLGLVLCAELWWIYFGADEDQAKRTMRDASVNQRLRMALFGFPTLRRAVRRAPDATTLPEPALLTTDIGHITVESAV